MTNHPNRNWRRRMAVACDAFLARWRWRPDEFALTRDAEMRELMRQSYTVGYQDGRLSTRPKRDDRPAV